MKTKTTFSGLALIMILTFALPIDIMGQEKGGPPSWAPAHGYRAKTSHVYFPDHNFYFDIQKNSYIYLNGNNWEVKSKLPLLYAGIDLNGVFKVELELGNDSPQKYNDDHLIKYKTGSKEGKAKGKKSNPGKGKKRK